MGSTDREDYAFLMKMFTFIALASQQEFQMTLTHNRKLQLPVLLNMKQLVVGPNCRPNFGEMVIVFLWACCIAPMLRKQYVRTMDKQLKDKAGFHMASMMNMLSPDQVAKLHLT